MVMASASSAACLLLPELLEKVFAVGLLEIFAVNELPEPGSNFNLKGERSQEGIFSQVMTTTTLRTAIWVWSS